MRKHTDYNSYLTRLKYGNLGNYLSQRNFIIIESQINSLNNTVNNDYYKKTENIYITKTPSFKEIGLDSLNTLILQPVDLSGTFFSIFNLPVNNQIPNGLIKNITNTCNLVARTQTIYIYSINTSTKLGGFNNLGQLYNCYIFPCNGDNLEVLWNSDQQNWCVQKYGGLFTNYTM